tara:strand:- start:54 stop:320 length:267 start_codon:yes stop_codon:yes gene_type:complete
MSEQRTKRWHNYALWDATTFDELKDSIEGTKEIMIRLDFTEKEIEANKQTQIDNFIDRCNDFDELEKLYEAFKSERKKPIRCRELGNI